MIGEPPFVETDPRFESSFGLSTVWPLGGDELLLRTTLRLPCESMQAEDLQDRALARLLLEDGVVATAPSGAERPNWQDLHRSIEWPQCRP